MPHQPTAIEIHFNNIVAYLTPTVTLLKELNDAFCPSFIQPISNIAEALINIVQNVKHNKNQCAQLMENIHQVLYAIINLYLKSEKAGSLDPAMLDHIGKFMGQVIYTFVEAQQDRSKIKYLFHNNEMQNLLKDCHVGLDQAVQVFAINTRSAMANDIGEMKKTAKTMHEELLELIQTLSDTSTNSDGSSVYLGTNDLNNSSNSFSMLPSKPKIFYGRESELDHIMKMLAQQPARIAILGGGGMGKTSLARAVLHHPETSAKFEYRFFILPKLWSSIFSRAPSLLLILDNLETVWDPIQSRGGIEEFLSLLTDVEYLTLIITMRGAERPAKVHWTHPFLLPLERLSDEAAQQTFMDITDNVYAAEDVNQILRFTDNMPLAVDLIAHLSDYEGLSNVLTRWKTEKTALLSVGYDRKSNLDSSITLSLSSPRITHNSKELLSLLSILPDGLTAAQLAHGNLPISNILSCKAALLATSLAYQDSNKCLRSLVPIREHIQQFLPPSKALIQSVCRHFYALLELYQTYNGEQLQPVMNQITLNLGNLHEVLQRGLDDSLSDHTDTISCILSLNSFHRITGRDTTILMNYIHPMLPELDDQLNIQFTIEILKSYTHPPGVDPQQLITKAIILFKHVKNPHLESLLNIAQIDTKIGGNAENNLERKKFDTAKSKFLESGERNNQIESFRLERLADIRAWPTSEWQFKWPVVYCGYAYKSKEKLALHKALLFLGDVFIANKDEETATNVYIVALEGFTYMDIHQSRAQCMIRLGDLAEGQGHTSEAIAFWEEARPLFKRSLQAKNVAQIDARLSTVEKAHQKALLELVISHAPVHLVVEETLEDEKFYLFSPHITSTVSDIVPLESPTPLSIEFGSFHEGIRGYPLVMEKLIDPWGFCVDGPSSPREAADGSTAGPPSQGICVIHLELALLDRPIGSSNDANEHKNPPPGWKHIESEVDGDAWLDGEDEDTVSDKDSDGEDFEHKECVAPCVLPTLLDSSIDLAAHFSSLIRLTFLQLAELLNPGLDMQDVYVSLKSDLAILSEWAALIRATRGTLKHLVLDQRPFAEEIKTDATGDTEFLVHYPYGPGYEHFVEYCLPALLEETAEWPNLKSICLYGFDVPPEMAEKHSSPIKPQKLGLQVEARFKPLGVNVRSGIGRRMLYEDDDGVVRPYGDALGGGSRRRRNSKASHLCKRSDIGKADPKGQPLKLSMTSGGPIVSYLVFD
ncbi:hypothetical protein B0H14DRAFT_3550792 [Mycena olivaceomarginata]|nr:hypothetical protein B0H14DRAFT_3550792 [Mycena olivaceomarginata]